MLDDYDSDDEAESLAHRIDSGGISAESRALMEKYVLCI